jgi:hypothetical protein
MNQHVMSAWLSQVEVDEVLALRRRHPSSRSQIARALIALGARVAKQDPDQMRQRLLEQSKDSPR